MFMVIFHVFMNLYVIISPRTSHHFHTTVAPLSRHCHTTFTSLSHHCRTTVTPLSHHFHTTVTPLSHHCRTTVAPLSHHCQVDLSFRTMVPAGPPPTHMFYTFVMSLRNYEKSRQQTKLGSLSEILSSN